MARGKSQFLRMFDAGSTKIRWHNYYVFSTVSWQDQPWEFQQFEADGFASGQIDTESGIRILMPATQFVMDTIAKAMRLSWLVEVTMYNFDTLLFGDDAPAGSHILVASHIGEIVGGGGGLETIEIEIGSSLAPVGAQIPPNKFTSRTIGVPCKL